MRKKQTIAILQHEMNEDAGFILNWLEERCFCFEIFEIWDSQKLPSSELFTGIITLGGESNIKDLERLLWMQREVSWLTDAIKNGIPILGVCLGAQILAHILGAEVRRLSKAEKGVHQLVIDLSSTFKSLNGVTNIDVLQAHGYRFDIPAGAKNIASSKLCEHQIFYHKQKKVMGIQCHLEWSNETFNTLFPMARLEGEGVDHDQTKSLLFSLLDFHFGVVVSD